MRILFDTNILILRENNHVIPDNLAKMMELLNGLSCTCHIHPLSKNEIKKDGNNERRNVNLSKLSAYSELASCPDYLKDESFIQAIEEPKNENDIVDNQLLYCVYKNAVDYLITEDQAILNKADILGLEQVMSINEAIVSFEQFYPKTDINLLPSFIIDKGYNFDLNDEIFTTLKRDYPEFSSYWWPKKVAKRDVYAYKSYDGKINAILVLKIEENENIDCVPTLKTNKILKICLFKVAEHAQGLRLGERLIRMAIDYAIANEVEEIYLTHFKEKKDSLIYLIEKFGFFKYGENSRGEEIFIKQIIKKDDKIDDILEINKMYYPSFYSGDKVKKHIVPIYPQFHKKLFPDHNINTRQRSLFDLTSSEGNSIKKAYICNSNTGKIAPGDILLFYRTNDNMSITTLGTVESVHFKLKSPEEIFKLIAKRTVFSFEEVKSICNSDVLVILFNQNFHLIHDVSYKTLCQTGVVSGPIQTITEISDKNYRDIIKGNIDERFIIH